MKNRFKHVLQTHCFKKALSIRNSQYRQEILQHTVFELFNDLGGYIDGDVTSRLLVPKSQRIEAKIVARDEGILAGIEEARFFLNGKWPHENTRPFGKLKLTILKKMV